MTPALRIPGGLLGPGVHDLGHPLGGGRRGGRGAGPGPDRANWTAVIENWVEKGIAPDRVIASKSERGKVVRTRPLCVYPQTAVYKGSGSTDDATNFNCQ